MRAEEEIQATVRFDGGLLSGKFPFWMTDEQIIRRARDAMPGFLANFTNPRVERNPAQ